MGLFARVLEAIFPMRESERVVREAADDALLSLLSPAIADEHARATALLPYAHPLVAASVKEAKYHGNGRAQEMLGLALAAYLEELVAENDAFEARTFVLVPVPLSPARLKERGYNQAERIAAAALRKLGIPGTPSAHLLRRVRDTFPQTTLPGKARRENVRDAFAASGADPAHTYIVVDDVVTTGATLSEASAALRQAGASRIIAVALAH